MHNKGIILLAVILGASVWSNGQAAQPRETALWPDCKSVEVLFFGRFDLKKRTESGKIQTQTFYRPLTEEVTPNSDDLSSLYLQLSPDSKNAREPQALKVRVTFFSKKKAPSEVFPLGTYSVEAQPERSVFYRISKANLVEFSNATVNAWPGFAVFSVYQKDQPLCRHQVNFVGGH